MIYSIVFSPHNSIQDNCFLSTVCQALSLESSVLRVILERSHLGFCTASRTKFWSQNPTNSTSGTPPQYSQICLLTALPWCWPSSFLTQKNAAASCVFGPPLSVHFHTKAARSDHELIMQRPSMAPHYLQKTASTLDSSTSLAPHYLCTSKFLGFLPSPFPHPTSPWQ